MAEVEDGARIKEYTHRLHELLAAGRRGDAVALFMAYVGMPAQAIDGIRTQPAWTMLEAIAPTLAYDDDVLAGGLVPRDLPRPSPFRPWLRPVGQPRRASAGGEGDRGRAAHRRVPILDRQTHDVAPEALAPVLIEFFGA